MIHMQHAFLIVLKGISFVVTHKNSKPKDVKQLEVVV